MPSMYTFMNIFITASPSDFNETEGLSGNFNGRTDDDMGNLDEDTFNSHWRASTTIYSGVPAHKYPKPATYSSCTQGFTPISKPGLDVSRCSSDSNDTTSALMLQSISTSSSSNPVPIPTQKISRKKRESINTSVGTTSAVNYTFEEAESNCSDYLKNSRTVKAFTNQLSDDRVKQSVTNCAFDLVSTGLFDWAVSHVSNLAEECITRAEQNQSSWTGVGDTPGEPVLPQAIVTQLCVRDCGDNGHCVNLFCKCENGYFGESCQFGPDTVPYIFGAEKACDIEETNCETVLLSGDYFSSSEKFSCKLNFASIDTTATKTESSTVVRAEYISMYQVGCTLPTRRSAYITVTNDGVHQSENVYLHVVHNSSCQTCVINDNKTDVHCTVTNSTCAIDGQCYFQNEEDPDDSCNICDANSNIHIWTRKTDCSDSLSKTAIILITVFSVLIVLAVVIAVYYIYRRKKCFTWSTETTAVSDQYVKVSLKDTEASEEKI